MKETQINPVRNFATFVSANYISKGVNTDKNKIVVGITMGDPSGIGPEIIIKALKRPDVLRLADFLVIGDRWVFEKFQIPNSKFKNYKFIDLDNVPHKNFKFGKIRADYGRAALEYIDKAGQLIKQGIIDCLVTAPVSKEAINLSGDKFIGHTEYLVSMFRVGDFAMMFVGGNLKVSLVTRHLPLEKVARNLTSDIVYKTIILTKAALRAYFGINNPCICVCGLNPHAGEGGHLGKQEKNIIAPAVKKAKSQFIDIFGPLSSEVAFHDTLRGRFDAVIAMYHDQGLVPLKMLYRDIGVNITLGLPFIRTSPDHGVAFDIAGRNQASSSSMIEAIKLAVECSSRQKRV